jgi:DNA-directed RNA polymerase subunit omega
MIQGLQRHVETEEPDDIEDEFGPKLMAEAIEEFAPIMATAPVEEDE